MLQKLLYILNKFRNAASGAQRRTPQMLYILNKFLKAEETADLHYELNSMRRLLKYQAMLNFSEEDSGIRKLTGWSFGLALVRRVN